ncbi:Mini-ribonuclease 3 [Thermicanus aegyptius]|uniref:Mini-ribonuclease 3 n=1 Tax=Thermicanus aegyptius TaxID=94009 RepID=UPI00034C1B28|nr:ribonuclease III domain-containing protein [Thermicanus aegyptius]
MEGYFHKNPLERNPALLNALTLAYLGDSVYEVYVRYTLIAQGKVNPHRLHREAIRFVAAKGQSRQLERIKEELTTEEEAIVRRARNSKPSHSPKHAVMKDYLQATAFEALIGYLFLTGKKERMEELIDLGIEEILKEAESK